jgi:L-seryl-tRNA(Ser) seleniumtransferase
VTDVRRDLPSVSSLLELGAIQEMLRSNSRAAVIDAIRGVLQSARESGEMTADVDWAQRVLDQVTAEGMASLRPVINATGIILHTNLGRAPLADAAIEAIASAARGFSNLEYDLESGRRGSRNSHCVALLRRLSGAEDAMVVNNGAAGLVLALNTFSRRKEVLVSRGELVEIGGSFRIPEIMERSGAKLVEVGTTNRTHADDYRRAISPKTSAIVKIHRSNFEVSGFTAEVSVKEIAFIAAEHGLPVIHDLGSGLMVPLDAYGLIGEPTVREAISAGPTVALMSGDKLLGGPQAGIIVGSAKAIAAMRANPLARALRVDKLTLAALEATLRIYLDEKRAAAEIPALAMISVPLEALRQRAARLADLLGDKLTVVESHASVGAGAFPTAVLPSVSLAITDRIRETDQRLREAEVPVIGRIHDGRLLLDLRSILPREDEALEASLRRALA